MHDPDETTRHAMRAILTQQNQGHRPMTSYVRLQRSIACLILAAGMTVLLWGCTAVPWRYIWMAESGVTLTALSSHQESYVGKVVLLGGTIAEEEENQQFLWLRFKNRPLDQDYIPHRPADPDSPEGGSYWVVISKKQLPNAYRNWARATVVGRVTGTIRYKTEPVLLLLYMRGWDASGKHHGVWENINPNYTPSIPGGIDVKN